MERWRQKKAVTAPNACSPCFPSWSVMDAMGTTTVAVPHAPTSRKLLSSSYAMARACTSSPWSRASCMSMMLVMDGRIEPELGVQYAPSALMPTKLETENSSMYFCCDAARGGGAQGGR